MCVLGGIGRCLFYMCALGGICFYLVKATRLLSCHYIILVVPGLAIIGQGETHGGLLLSHQVTCDCSLPRQYYNQYL